MRGDGLPGDSQAPLPDALFLVTADPEQVREELVRTPGPAGRLADAVYRASAHLHGQAGPRSRRQLLALDAARYGDLGLSARIAAVPVGDGADLSWGVAWATGSTVDHRFRHALLGHTERVCSVATGVVEGRPVAVTCSSDDRTVRVWDLATGRPVGELPIGDSEVRAVATGVLRGRTVVVAGSRNGTVRVWDLATGHPVGSPLTGHTEVVDTVATAVLDGRLHGISGSRDGTVRIWDLTTCRLVGEALTGDNGGGETGDGRHGRQVPGVLTCRRGRRGCRNGSLTGPGWLLPVPGGCGRRSSRRCSSGGPARWLR
jgi:hypothetical protein